MKKPEILVVDDEVEVGNFFEYYLREERGYPVTIANSGNEARFHIKNNLFNLALVDLKLPDTNGLALLKEIKDKNPSCEVVIMTGYSTVRSAVEAMKMGALDYIDKPFNDLDELDRIMDRAVKFVLNKQSYIDNEVEKLASEFGIIMAKKSPLKNLLMLCKKVATRKISVLIEGETGTGKELVARFIHSNSLRVDHSFTGVNCGALTETLLESELFGHEKGAFTGAQGLRRGIFELAHKGTLFLDEVGEATPAIQVKLLRVLETGEFFRVGGEKPIKTDVRVIAATNINLREAVKDKLFREDLLYRLDVVRINIPPLRERPMDIRPLVEYFIEKNLPKEEINPNVSFSPEAIELLEKYPWPGNVRELSNAIARSMALRTGNVLGPDCLPEHIKNLPQNYKKESGYQVSCNLNEALEKCSDIIYEAIINEQDIDLKNVSERLKNKNNNIVKRVIEKYLETTGNNKKEAAKLLHVTPRVLRYLQNEKN